MPILLYFVVIHHLKYVENFALYAPPYLVSKTLINGQKDNPKWAISAKQMLPQSISLIISEMICLSALRMFTQYDVPWNNKYAL